jgi:hypothetical protein
VAAPRAGTAFFDIFCFALSRRIRQIDSIGNK